MDDPKDAEVSTDKGEQVVVPIDVVTDEYSWNSAAPLAASTLIVSVRWLQLNITFLQAGTEKLLCPHRQIPRICCCVCILVSSKYRRSYSSWRSRKAWRNGIRFVPFFATNNHAGRQSCWEVCVQRLRSADLFWVRQAGKNRSSCIRCVRIFEQHICHQSGPLRGGHFTFAQIY